MRKPSVNRTAARRNARRLGTKRPEKRAFTARRHPFAPGLLHRRTRTADRIAEKHPPEIGFLGRPALHPQPAADRRIHPLPGRFDHRLPLPQHRPGDAHERRGTPQREPYPAGIPVQFGGYLPRSGEHAETGRYHGAGPQGSWSTTTSPATNSTTNSSSTPTTRRRDTNRGGLR